MPLERKKEDLSKKKKMRGGEERGQDMRRISFHGEPKRNPQKGSEKLGGGTSQKKAIGRGGR